MQTIFTAACGDCGLERLAINTRFQARVNLAPWLSGEHDPGFCLSQVWRHKPCPLLVVGVNLNGERLIAVKEFEQQWKLGLRMVTTKKIIATPYHEFVQFRAGQWAVGDDALIVSMVHDFPAFGIIITGADRFAQRRAQSSSAPQVLSQDGLES
jgi:hypothetical protein